MVTATKPATELLQLAIESRDAAHVHIRYAAHVDSLSVDVYPVDHEYSGKGAKPPIYSSGEIYLDGHYYDSAERLADVISDVKRILAEM